jgi:uncharacterized protein (DUF1501 family)
VKPPFLGHSLPVFHSILLLTFLSCPGQLRGGEMFGRAPSLVPGGADDAEEQGCLIPTISQDQVNAAICDWFGVLEDQVGRPFPNLTKFRKGPGLNSAYLDLFG